MAKTNTEKPIGKSEKKRQGIVKTPKQKKNIQHDELKTQEKRPQPQEELSVEKNQEIADEKKEEKSEAEKKPEEKKKPIQKKPLEKKTEAVINGFDLRISTKKAVAICKFIKGKKIDDAISDLEKVVILKKVIPMKGEIPHRKGEGMMSGRYPKKTAESFINLLKTLKGNSSVNEIEEPVITEAVANIASKPYGKFGRWRRKRTHVKIIAKSKINKKEGN